VTYPGRLGIVRDVRNDLLRGHLDRLLLAVLDGESGHGYALCQRIEERSGGEPPTPRPPHDSSGRGS
jgi:hypothetical protein